MITPTLIDGVLVHRRVGYKQSKWLRSSGFCTEVKFTYHRYTFPNTAIRPGTHSQCINMLCNLLRIRVLYTHTPLFHETVRDLDLVSATFFFGYWPAANWPGLQCLKTENLIFYRDDLKPLHEKQVEALWKFCDRLVMVITPPLGLEYKLSNRVDTLKWLLMINYDHDGDAKWVFNEIIKTVGHDWKNYCTVDNFHAFFGWYRNERLLEGCEDWRDVRSLYDL